MEMTASFIPPPPLHANSSIHRQNIRELISATFLNADTAIATPPPALEHAQVP